MSFQLSQLIIEVFIGMLFRVILGYSVSAGVMQRQSVPFSFYLVLFSVIRCYSWSFSVIQYYSATTTVAPLRRPMTLSPTASCTVPRRAKRAYTTWVSRHGTSSKGCLAKPWRVKRKKKKIPCFPASCIVLHCCILTDGATAL